MYRPASGCLRRLALTMAIAALPACTSVPPAHHERPPAFEFERDTLAFANELFWDYHFDDVTGEVHRESHGREVSFGNRCNPMAKSIRQFRHGARFDASLPLLMEDEYRERVQLVLATDPRSTEPVAEPIVIPGYPGLRAFSRDHESLMKQALGGRRDSYLQRGNVRMIFPFLPGGQRETAADILASVRDGRPAIVRLVRFPNVDINHTIVVFDAEETPREIRFQTFDPNHPEAPTLLRFQRASAAFLFPRTTYFAGGEVGVYEIYEGIF